MPRTKTAARKTTATAAKTADTFVIEVTLTRVAPRVRRLIEIKESDTLHQLHLAIQGAMGWELCHLHAFRANGVEYGDPEMNELEEIEDENEVRLAALLAPGMKLEYEYDFGDGWTHTIKVKKKVAAIAGAPYPRCVSGENACPPEDVGGPDGYAEALDALEDPGHERHDEVVEWFPRRFDPEAFDVAKANAHMRAMRRLG